MSHAQRQDAAERPYAAPAQRTPVQFDPATSGLRIGEHERRVDPSQPSSVYEAYLSLLYSVRGASRGQQLPLRAADLEALLLIVGDDPATIEQRLVGLMGCSAEEARALGGILLRHRKLTATLGIAATLSLGGAAVVAQPTGDTSAEGTPIHSAIAPTSTDAPLENRRSIEPEAAAPTAAEPAPAGTTSVVVAEPPAPAVAPARVRTAAPKARAAAPAPAAPAPVAADPAPAAPAPAVPVDAPAPAPVDMLPAPPADDAPAPVDGELPDADIGDPAYEEAVPPEEVGGIAAPEEIGGITDPSIGHDDPVAPPEVALPFPNAPRVEVVIGPELVVPVVEPEPPAPAPADGDAPKL